MPQNTPSFFDNDEAWQSLFDDDEVWQSLDELINRQDQQYQQFLGEEFQDPEINSNQFQRFLNQNQQNVGIQQFAQQYPKAAEKIYNTSSAAGNLFEAQLNKLRQIPGQVKPIVATAVNAIRGPLGYNNPTVAVDSPLVGQTINPEALNWIREQEKRMPIGNLDAMGGTVKIEPENYGEDNILDIAFSNPVGYGKPSEIKKRLQQLEAIDPKTFVGSIDDLSNAITQLKSDLKEAKGSALMPSAIRYQLGRAISAAPENTILYASPIGGAKGERARLYKRLSNSALETIPYPTDEEFRIAQETQSDPYHPYAGKVRTTKTGPEEFVTGTGKQVKWNPEELKDPMIRAAFNLDKNLDVSGLRANPMSEFLNKGLASPQGYIDFSKPIITPNSPLYRAGRGIVGSTKVGITDLIPSRQVVQNIYNNQPVEAVKTLATDFLSGIPQALAVGGAVAAAPVLAPVATSIGGGMAITKAVNAADEAYRQTTGKSWTQRNKPASPYSTYAGPTPTIQPRMGTAILGGRPVQVPYGSVAGEKRVGRPWWDKAGSQFQGLLNRFNPIIGR